MSGKKTIEIAGRILMKVLRKIGKNVTNAEFVADEISKRTIQVALSGGVMGTFYLIGYSNGSDGSKHEIYNDPKTGKRYMKDDNNTLHELVD